MTSATFVFYGGLNDLLPRDKRGIEINLDFASHQSIKHLIEALGIPHMEVGSISTNGQHVPWCYRPVEGNRIEVLPATGCPIEPNFILDNHLGRLAAYLRMLGFDSLYENSFSDDQMAEIVAQDPRILLTRDRRLLMRKVVLYGYCLRSLDPQVQVQEVVTRFHLQPMLQPFHRCLHCNGLLEPVPREVIFDRLEPRTKLYYNEFSCCSSCGKVYWKGSHYDHMQALIANISA